MTARSLRTRTAVGVAPVASAAAFLGLYLAVGPVMSALSDRPLPLPAAPAQDAVAYTVANPGASLATAALQTLSVLAFGAFARHATARVAEVDPRRATIGRTTAYVSVAFMLVSSLLGVAMVALIDSVSADTFGVLRSLTFLAGGHRNVTTLVVFV